MKLMSFKAEELQKYVGNQWNLLLDYKLQDNPEFVNASKLAIEAYARSIVRSDTELIIAIDDVGRFKLSRKAAMKVVKADSEASE